MTRARLVDPLLALLVFVIAITVYLSGRDVITITDSRWALYVAESLMRSGDLNLDEYAHLMRPGDEYTITRAGGHIYSYFPIGAPLAAAPYMAVLDRLAPSLWGIDLYAYLQQAKFDAFVAQLELTWACVIASAAAAIVYLSARQELVRWRSLLLAAIFAFGTAVWSTASRALWQHGPSLLLLALALFLALRARRDARSIRYASAILMLACIVRPTNVIALVAFTVYVALGYRRQLAAYLLGAAIVAAPFALYSLGAFGTLLPPYYRAGRLALHPHFWEALAGNLVSPGRGLLVYSPVFLLCGYGVWRMAREGKFDALAAALAIIIGWHWLVLSLFPHWWGGHAYGPRLFSDVTPLLMFFLIPVLAAIHLKRTLRAAVLPALLVVLATSSIFVHYRGATDLATWQWNWPIPRVLTPAMGDVRYVEDVDVDPARLWEWRDAPFLRGLRAVQPAVLPPVLKLEALQEDLSPHVARLTIINVGDGRMHWEAVAPQGVILPVPPNDEPRRINRSLWPVEPFHPQTLVVLIDIAELPPGTHELGEIVLRGFPVDRKRVRGSPVRVPVQVVVEGDSSD